MGAKLVAASDHARALGSRQRGTELDTWDPADAERHDIQGPCPAGWGHGGVSEWFAMQVPVREMAKPSPACGAVRLVVHLPPVVALRSN